jgi:hypothetical protein
MVSGDRWSLENRLGAPRQGRTDQYSLADTLILCGASAFRGDLGAGGAHGRCEFCSMGRDYDARLFVLYHIDA